MAEAALLYEQISPIIVVGNELPHSLQESHYLHVVLLTLDRISDFDTNTYSLIPLVILHLPDPQSIAATLQVIQKKLKPLQILGILSHDPPAELLSGSVQWGYTNALTIEDIAATYTVALADALHYSHQLTQIFAKNTLDSDSQIYQELQLVSDTLHSEAIGVFIVDQGKTFSLFGVNSKTAQHFNQRNYAIPQDSVLAAAIETQQSQTVFITDDEITCKLLAIKSAASVYLQPILLNDRQQVVVLTACDLSTQTINFLTPFLDMLGKRVAGSVAQRTKQHQHERKELLLSMMELLVDTSTIQEIQTLLCQTIEQVPMVRQAILWQQQPTDHTQHQYFSLSHSEALNNRLLSLKPCTYFDAFIDQFKHDIAPIYLHRDTNAPEHVQALYDVLRTELIVLVPMYTSAFIHGLVMVVPFAENLLQPIDVHFVALMAEAAGQAMERQWSTQWQNASMTWLEAVARHSSEGFIYVGETGTVEYITPRFTELTGIPSTDLLEQNTQTVLDTLSCLGTTKENLQGVYQAALDGDDTLVIQLWATGDNRRLWFSIVPIEQPEDRDTAWLGIVREPADISAAGTIAEADMHLLRLLPAYISSYQARAVGLLRSLAMSGGFNDVRQSYIVNSTLEELQAIGNLANDTLKILSMRQTPSTHVDTLPTVFVALGQMVQQALSQVQNPTAFHMKKPLQTVQVKVIHEGDVANAIERVLRFLQMESTPPITISFSSKHPFNNIHITHQISGDAYSQLEQAIYGDTADVESDLVNSLSMYLVQQIILQEQGFITLDANEMVISLPSGVADETEEYAGMPLEVEDRFNPELADDTNIPPLSIYPVETIVICIGESEIMRTAIDVIREAGYELSVQRNIADSLWYLDQQNSCDLILVDDSLRGEDALEFATSLRKRTHVPIMLMGDRENIARADVLEHGIDTYLTQPIAENVMLLEIKAMIRRSPHIQDEPIRVRDLEIDLLRYTVTLAGHPVDLTRLEYKLLRVLAINAGQVLEYEQLLRQVWGPEYINDKQHLYTFINRLRRKLESKDDDQRYIHTRSGVGYILK